MGATETNAALAKWWARDRDPARLPTIALAVQGASNNCVDIQKNYAAMAQRGAVSLFLLSYSDAFDCADSVAAAVSAGGPPHAVCIHAPGTSWTTGRNSLARAIYQAERARGAKFTWWVFADQDVANPGGIECNNKGGGATACAERAGSWDALVRALLLPLEHPFLYVGNPLPPEAFRPYEPPTPAHAACKTCVTVLPIDCGDAMLTPIHRDAVHLFLPYFTQLDAVSWWSSMAALYHMTSCVSGAGGMLVGFDLKIEQHLSYPRGRPDIAGEIAVVRTAFPGLAEWPLNLSSAPTVESPANSQGDCHARNLPYSHLDGASPADVAKSRGWKDAAAFKKCARSTEPRFCSFVKNVGQPFKDAGDVGAW